MKKQIVANIFYDKTLNDYKAISEDGSDVTKAINNKNKLKYAYTNKRVIVGTKDGKSLKWKTKKTNKVKGTGYDWRTREQIEEELQREINKETTKYYIKGMKND